MAQRVSRRNVLAGAAAVGAASGFASAGPGAADAIGGSDAVGLAQRIRNREITAAEALEAAIARAQRTNPQLNFLASPAFEYGRRRAAAALSGPFAGVPTLIKDLMPVTGLPTHYGSRAFANAVADGQPPYVDALLAAGLVPFGKSTTPEFGLLPTTEPLLGGPTRNPWDVQRSCGGSSGGAAVAVAARVVAVAHASDGGGSIRIPASCNGVFGLKPSRDRAIAASAADPGISLSTPGCVSVSVRDSAAWLAATERQGASAALAPVGLVTGASGRRLRVAVYIEDALGQEPDPEVRAATEAAAALCRSLGHETVERRWRLDGEAFARDFTLLWCAGAAQVVDRVRAAAPRAPLDQALEPLTLALAETFARAPRGEIEAAIGRLRALAGAYAQMFDDADVMLTPVLAKPPLPLGEISPDLGLVAFNRLRDYASYTPLQNVVGAPAMSVPLGWSRSGLPIGAHFAAPVGQERRLLELAYALEAAQPWAGRMPGVNAA